MISILERSDVKSGKEENSLAKKCRENLGYSFLHDSETPSEVADAFAKVGIRPFDPDSVVKYKNYMIAELSVPAWMGVFCIACLVVAVASVILGCAIDRHFLFGLFSLVVMVLAIIIIFSEDWSWKMVDLCDYKKPVPEYALVAAIQLDEELEKNGVEDWDFHVEELVRQERSADPFLVLSVGTKHYYLEVWDEPDFGAERTV